MYLVIRHGVWIGNWIYWTLVTTDNNDSVIAASQSSIDSALSVGKIADGPRQQSKSWFRVPSEPKPIYYFPMFLHFFMECA
jgi:hypothetical protein